MIIEGYHLVSAIVSYHASSSSSVIMPGNYLTARAKLGGHKPIVCCLQAILHVFLSEKKASGEFS